jgi:uncharacterized protein (DUF433 family)
MNRVPRGLTRRKTGLTMATATKSLIQIDQDGVAWIEGTTAKVIEIVLAKRAHNWTPEKVQAELPHLSLAQVYAALAYYHAHKEELDAELERRRQWAEEQRTQEQNPLSRAELEARRPRQE